MMGSWAADESLDNIRRSRGDHFECLIDVGEKNVLVVVFCFQKSREGARE